MLAAATCDGVGNLLVAMVVVESAAAEWSKRSMKRALMAFAAAPETCWEIMPDARDSKGSIFSASPAGEKIRQWWAVIRGSMRGSTVSGGQFTAASAGLYRDRSVVDRLAFPRVQI